ncbi:hypothetical protein ABT369_09015 [Dactylosporangium sp. NPDC000244]|uniref:hypothetical protein n=1 Tax=Dactylosporangium sp. NPDC000244 TaxID=3154365 RepID=UPI003320205E
MAELRSASPVVHAAAAIGLLRFALVLSVYKPRGVTPWAGRTVDLGRRRSGSRAISRAGDSR